MSQDPQAVLAHLEQIRTAAARRSQSAGRAVTRMQNLGAEAWSPRREVRVVVDASGLVQDVEYAASAPSSSPLALARAFQRAHDDALERLQASLDAVADEEFAADPQVRDSIKRAARDSLPPRIDDGEA